MSSTKPIHLEPSELGTKAYWDEFYGADLSTPPSPRSPLDGWFSDVNATFKILRLLQTSSLRLDPKVTNFLDLGTGNGEMLFRLREKGGFEGRMLGVDYCAPSIELARKIATTMGLDDVKFEQWDVMQDPQPEEWQNAFDVVLDKGTFDAISLSGEKDEHGRRSVEGYRERVENLVKRDGYFVVTSCNWTRSELVHWFTGPEGSDHSLKVYSEVSYPTFLFGGQTGQSISTLCFKNSIHP